VEAGKKGEERMNEKRTQEERITKNKQINNQRKIYKDDRYFAYAF
jgi:hypothetical protein